jgi:hypothetical protein
VRGFREDDEFHFKMMKDFLRAPITINNFKIV